MTRSNLLFPSAHRRKCRLASNGGPCVRCTTLSLKCSLTMHFHPRAVSREILSRTRPLRQKNDSSVIATELTVERDPLSSYALRRELVLLYFQHVHDKHHSLFHQPSVELELEDGRVPEILLYAMMSLGARYVVDINPYSVQLRNTRFSKTEELAHAEPRHRGSKFVAKAKALLDMDDISVTTIQACVLLGTISFSESKTESEALYYALANRLAFILDLPHRPTRDEVERQVNLRSMHTIARLNYTDHGSILDFIHD